MSRKAMYQTMVALLGLGAMALIVGCPGQSPGGGGTFTDTGTGVPITHLRPPGIYVTNQNNSVTIFALDASGNAAPTRTIKGDHTQLSLPIGIAMDTINNLYVANRTGAAVTVYPSDADGDVTPTRMLTNPDMGSPEYLAIGLQNDVFVSACPGCGSGAGGQSGIFHFDTNANASDYRIGGTSNNNTGFTNPSCIALDNSNPALGPRVVVGNSFGGNVAVFAPGASGDVLPIQKLQPRSGANLQSMAIAGNALFLVIPDVVIDVYSPNAVANNPPAATLAPSATFPVNYPAGLAIDNSVTPPVGYLADYFGNAVYVIKTIGVPPALAVDSVVTIKGDATGLDRPLGVLVVK